MRSMLKTTKQYQEWLKQLKQKVVNSQLKAAVAVNQELIRFYWELGTEIIEKQQQAQWGSGFLNQLSADLSAEFPNIKGFSVTNLRFIRRWALFYLQDSSKTVTACDRIEKQQLTEPIISIIKQIIQIPWGHNRVIITKCSNTDEALFYVQQTIENNWSRSVLTHQIESQLHTRQGQALTNFQHTLPTPQSDLAQQIIKDPYNFDFLTLSKKYSERELENQLVDHVTQFLLELGSGFAYLGKQVPLQVGKREFFLDLLFYHTQLHCYIVIELKTEDFEPEFAGKLNFYIKAVDEQYSKPGDNPTIGLLLCKSKDQLVVDYSLSDILKPMGVTEYELTKSLPDQLKSSLPTIEQIEAELKK